jgi:hypothetical protein
MNTRDPSYLPEGICATSDPFCLPECMRATSCLLEYTRATSDPSYLLSTTYTQPLNPPTSTIHAVMASTLFQLVDQVVFEPIQSEPPQVAKAFLPASFLIRSHPFDYFTLFFTHALLELITKHKISIQLYKG